MEDPIKDMTTERFDALLDLHGPDLMNWPQEERASARQLLAHSELARKSLSLDMAIAKLLAAEPTPKAPSSLVDRIMNKVKK